MKTISQKELHTRIQVTLEEIEAFTAALTSNESFSPSTSPLLQHALRAGLAAQLADLTDEYAALMQELERRGMIDRSALTPP